MAVPSTKRFGVGLRWVNLFELNASGSPNAPGTTAYEGVQIEGSKALTLTVPESRQIVHTGDDRVLKLDLLPPLDAPTGEMRSAKVNDAIDDIVTLNNSFDPGSGTDGETRQILIGTDNQGSEPLVGILAFQQAIDASGARSWEYYILSKAWVIPRTHSMDDNPAEIVYTVRPQIVSKHLWETSFVLALENATEGQIVRGVSEHKPKIIAFLGAGGQTTYSFPADAPAQATTKIIVWVDGVLQTTGVTKATNSITFGAAPGANKRIVVFYESLTP